MHSFDGWESAIITPTATSGRMFERGYDEAVFFDQKRLAVFDTTRTRTASLADRQSDSPQHAARLIESLLQAPVVPAKETAQKARDRSMGTSRNFTTAVAQVTGSSNVRTVGRKGPLRSPELCENTRVTSRDAKSGY